MATYIEKEKIGLTDFEIIMCEGNYKQALELLLDKIENAPTINIEQGEWFNDGDEYYPNIKCSVCRQKKPILSNNFKFNYCPNCGAKMKE